MICLNIKPIRSNKLFSPCTNTPLYSTVQQKVQQKSPRHALCTDLTFIELLKEIVQDFNSLSHSFSLSALCTRCRDSVDVKNLNVTMQRSSLTSQALEHISPRLSFAVTCSVVTSCAPTSDAARASGWWKETSPPPPSITKATWYSARKGVYFFMTPVCALALSRRLIKSPSPILSSLSVAPTSFWMTTPI